MKGEQSIVLSPASTVWSPLHAPGRHMLASQRKPSAQSASAAQIVLQASAAQPKGSHVLVLLGPGAGQFPCPSQLSESSAIPSVQLAARQLTVEPTKPLHVVRSIPSQTFSEQGSPVVPAAHAARVPCGLSETGRHVPAAPATSQASHWPRQGALQQTPSAHSPVEHASFAVQGCPATILGRHVPASHQAVGAQSAAVAHVVRQAPSVHKYSPQSCGFGLERQEPKPLQTCPTGTLATQLARLHGVPEM